MKNKYAKRARISEAKIREIVRYVAADLTALQAAALSGLNRNGIVKLRLTAVFDAQHGGFATSSSPVSWGSIDVLFVNLTIPFARLPRKLHPDLRAIGLPVTDVLALGREHPARYGQAAF